MVAYSAVLGVGVTEELGTFIEFFGEAATGQSAGPANSIDFGWTYLLAENLQIDMLAGFGLSDEAADWFIGAGVVYRFGGNGQIERVENLNRRRNIVGARRY
ncbi:MAG: transporter [Planctomycetes bacterium]|nr:transporter [Planctomycetota bacterium]